MRQFIDLLNRIERLDFLESGIADIDDVSFGMLKNIPSDSEWVPKGQDSEAASMAVLNGYMHTIRKALYIENASIQECIRGDNAVCSLVSKRWVYCAGWDRTNWRSMCHFVDINIGSVTPLDSLRSLVISICVARHQRELGNQLQTYWSMATTGSDGSDGSSAATVSVEEFNDEAIFEKFKTIPVNNEWLPRGRVEEESCIAKLESYLEIVDNFLFYDTLVSINLTVKDAFIYFLITFDGIGYYVGWSRNDFTFKCCMVDFKGGGPEIVNLESLRDLVCILCTAQKKPDLVTRLDGYWAVPAMQSLNLSPGRTDPSRL